MKINVVKNILDANNRIAQENRTLFDEKNIYAHMSEIVAGLKPGRTSQNERILTHLVGLGVHDIAVSYKAWKQAEKLGVGKEFAFL